MRIVIDLQSAQTLSRHRGIGRYSLSLAKAMIEQGEGHEFFLALNGRMSDGIEWLRAEFGTLLPAENIRTWFPSGDHTTHLRRAADEKIREAFLASLRPDVIHVTSLFEGFGDASVCSVRAFSQIPTAVTLYDLIPFIHSDRYLTSPYVERWYLARLNQLKRADLLLGISASACREAADYLGIPDERTVNISSAADESFVRLEISPAQELELRQKFGLTKPFLMYTGGIDHRKNIDGLIRAFAHLPSEMREAHQLAVVCSVNDDGRRALMEEARRQGLTDRDVVLTGFVTDSDLMMLYNLCKLFVFPSWHEGFGLPVLEAMRCGAPVVAANSSSLPEVVGRDDSLFAARSDSAMTEKLIEVLSDDALRGELVRHGFEQAQNFSWKASASRALEAMQRFNEPKPRSPVASSVGARRKRMAYLSPLPPARSGISDYSAQLIPELSRFYDVDVIHAQRELTDQAVLATSTARDVGWFIENSHLFDRVLYHFGNSEFHEHMFGLIEQVPGVVVLHDFFLSGVLENSAAKKGRLDEWALELYRSHGYAAAFESLTADSQVAAIAKYPCNFPVLERSLGVIVHSEHSVRLAESWYGQGVADDWKVIPLLRAPNVRTDRESARAALGLSKQDFVVCTYGHVHPTKLSHRLLEAWISSSLARGGNCYLFFVGENHAGQYGIDLQARINEAGVDDRVRVVGWSDSESFNRYLAAADVAVQLRALSRGETSASVLDCMNNGLATIVNANGSMADLDPSAVFLLPDDFDDAALVDALERLHSDSGLRSRISNRAKTVIVSQHSPHACARAYFDAVESQYALQVDGPLALAEGLSATLTQAGSADRIAVAEAAALSLPTRRPQKQWLIDVSGYAQSPESQSDPVVQAELKALILNPPPGFRVEPVYALAGDYGYRYARSLALRVLDCELGILADELVEVAVGDQFSALDEDREMQHGQGELLSLLVLRGLRLRSMESLRNEAMGDLAYVDERSAVA